MDRYTIRTVLNTLFLVGALVAMILYFAVEDKHAFFYACSAALTLKFIEIVLRIMR